VLAAVVLRVVVVVVSVVLQPVTNVAATMNKHAAAM
jgi:hypothetical protein